MPSGFSGDAFSFEPNTRFFGRPQNDTRLSKLETFALQRAEIEGVKNISTITCDVNTADSIDGEGFYIETTLGIRVYWYFSTAGTKPSVVGALSYQKITILATETADEVARKTELIIDDIPELIVSRVGAIVTTKGTVGGAVDGIVDIDTGFAIANPTPGVGTFSQIGDIKDGVEFTPDDGFTSKNSEKVEKVLSYVYNGSAFMTNLGEETWDIIRSEFLLEIIDLVALDVQNEKITTFYAIGVKKASIMTVGEEGGVQMDFNATYQARKFKGSTPPIEFWSSWLT